VLEPLSPEPLLPEPPDGLDPVPDCACSAAIRLCINDCRACAVFAPEAPVVDPKLDEVEFELADVVDEVDDEELEEASELEVPPTPLAASACRISLNSAPAWDVPSVWGAAPEGEAAIAAPGELVEFDWPLPFICCVK
jgi:hypothetical protein